MSATILAAGLGAAAAALSTALFLPQSRGVIASLRALVDALQARDAALFRDTIAPITPFVDGAFVHKRITGMLRADLTAFGPECQALQQEARAFDRRAHLAMIPVLSYLAGLGLWFVLR
jgi:hypothetical protein